MSEIIMESDNYTKDTDFFLEFLHELRAGLTVIGGYTSLLLEGEVGDVNNEQAGNLRFIEDTNRQMIKLCNETTELIHLEKGLSDWKRVDVDLRKLLENEFEKQRQLIRSRELKIELKFTENIIMAKVDLNAFSKALSYIIQFLITFSKSNDRIVVEGVKRPGNWMINFYPGSLSLPPDELPLLFSPFSKIESFQNANLSQGLGLIIARSVIGKQQGKLYVENIEGKGNVIVCLMPIRKDEDKKRILIVEDNNVIARMWTGKLSKEYTVDHASNGQEGLKKAVTEKPDLILLDVLMPGIDGFAVCEQLRQDPKLDKVPIVFLSNLLQEDMVEKAKKLGALDFINKSTITPSELAKRVGCIMEELNAKGNGFKK